MAWWVFTKNNVRTAAALSPAVAPSVTAGVVAQ
jgi:hypothetical protein